MTSEEKLSLAKQNLQRLDTSNDTLIQYLLLAADNYMKTEGLTDDGSIEYDYIVVDYACYLFRKRSASTAGDTLFGSHGETAMPRYLRWNMNNLLLKQKGSAEA